MISDESYELIGILLGAAMGSAADDQRQEYYERCSQARYEFITMMDREKIPAESSNRALVDQAVERHAVEMLKLSVHRPQPGEIFPAHPFAQAQWHLMRIEALRAAPVELAAAQLREEALTALKSKEKPDA